MAKHKYDGTFLKFPYKVKFGYSSYDAYYHKKGYYVTILTYDPRTGSHFRLVKKYYYKTLSGMQKKIKQLNKTKRWNLKKTLPRKKSKSKKRK